MRILLFTSQMNFVNYAQAFRSLNHQFTIVTLITKRERHRYEMTLSRFGGAASNVVYSPIYLRASNDRLASLLNPINLVHDFGKIFTTIRAWRPEAVIGMFVIHAYPLVVLKRILKFSLFALVSGSDLTFHNGLVWRLVRRAVFRNSLAVFTVAKRFNPQIERESGCTPIVIPTGTNPDYYTPLPNNVDLRGKYNFEVSDFIILSLSSLIELKRIDDVIRAVRIIKSEHPQTKMIIAGDGPEKAKLMKLCADFGVECVFTGFVGEAEKRDLYNIADVYVLASRSEGMPFSVTEAMACGCICVCTDVGDIPEIIVDSVNGYLIKTGDPNLIAMKIREAMNLTGPQLRLIRERARQTVVDGYDFRKLTHAMVNVIEEKVSREKN